MFKKLFAYFKEEKELMKKTEELHAETERILREDEERKNNPVFRPIERMKMKFVDTDGNVFEVELGSEKFDELIMRQDVHLVFD